MPATLGSAQTGLEGDLDAAYAKARADGAEGIDVIPALATDVANAIHLYMLEALVTTSVDVDTGQPDAPAGGTTQSPGTGTGTGELA